MDWNNEPGFDTARERYIQLDLTAWLKKHGIEEKGRHQGAMDQPATDSDELDGTEAFISDFVNRRARVCRDNVTGHLADLERDLVDMENDQQLVTQRQRVGQMEQDAKLALERKVGEGRNALVSKERDVREDDRNFHGFRATHGLLDRQPDYSQRDKALPFILVCFFVEVVLNASLLMEVNAFGLIGSTAQMGLISAVNVLIGGLAMGGLLRQSNLRAVPRKLLAWLWMAGVLSLVAAFNLLVGHFRDSMQAVVNDPGADFMTLGSDVFDRFAASPAGLDSFQSYLLAMLGFLFFCVAAWKWLQRDDPHPDYGRRHRQLEGLKGDYLKRYDEAQDELREVFAEHESRLEDIREQLEIKLSKWRDICVRGERLVREFPLQMHQYLHDLEFLMSAYRTANASARSAPPPPHFETQPEIESDLLDSAPSFSPPAETSLAEVMAGVHRSIEQVQETYRDMARRYPTLDQLLADGSPS